MATIQHQDIAHAYMHPPAAIDFAVDPSAYAPPKADFLYNHVPSGTLWRSTGTNAGDLVLSGYSKDLQIVTKLASYQLNADVLALSKDSILFMDSASPVTVTVPLNASYPFPIGYRLAVYKVGDGDVLILPEGGVTLESPGNLSIQTKFNFGTLIKVLLDGWYFLPNGAGEGGGGSLDAALINPIDGSILVDPVSGTILSTPV